LERSLINKPFQRELQMLSSKGGMIKSDSILRATQQSTKKFKVSYLDKSFMTREPESPEETRL
jgi:hypothetical protein